VKWNRKRREGSFFILRELTDKLRNGTDLSGGDIDYAVTLLLSDQTDDESKAEFLTALHRKGESAEEIAAFVRLLMERAIDPMIDPASVSGPMIDVCGTGGDGLDFFNVSTTIMFVLAAGGAVVVKHGNRSVTSSCGSADVLEELRVPIDLTPEDLRECVKQNGVGFLFARQYHPAFRSLAQMRERLARQKTRTIFNLLGPLLNPARPSNQMIGVFSPDLTTVFADVLHQLGRKRAWVVHGLGENGQGMDDVSICGATTVAELDEKGVTSAVIDVSWLGIPRSSTAELQGGNVKENAATLEGILSRKISGPKRDMTIVNAGAGFVVAGLANDLKDGMELAGEEIDSGRALEKLRAMQNYERKFSR
jgi:anthranilate phosphoribosyltransferase